MKRLRASFITGILVLVPVIVTVEVLLWTVQAVDNSLRAYLPAFVLKHDFPGFGFALAIIVIFVVGLLTHNFVGRWIMLRVDNFVQRFPFVGAIYKTVKQFLSTVFDSSSDRFKQAVLVPYPKEGFYMIGFLTGEPHPKLLVPGRGKMVNIFVPMTPNPTSGFYMVVDESTLIPIDMPVQEAFKTMISMGIVGEEKKA